MNKIRLHFAKPERQRQREFNKTQSPPAPEKIFDKDKCSQCQSNPVSEIHYCPYSSEMDEDCEEECNCCDECMGNCALDI